MAEIEIVAFQLSELITAIMTTVGIVTTLFGLSLIAMGVLYNE